MAHSHATEQPHRPSISRWMQEIHTSRNVTSLLSTTIESELRDQSLEIERDTQRLASLGRAILETHLPTTHLDALQAMRSREASALIFRNLVSFDVPPTPADGFINDLQMRHHDAVLAGILARLDSCPTAFPFENFGRIGRNVVPVAAMAGKASSHGFDADLWYHQDNCGQPFERELTASLLPPMPLYLAFLCLRNDESVPTRLLSIDDIVAALPDIVLAYCLMPEFRIGAPQSVQSETQRVVAIERSPLLRTNAGLWEMRYDPFLVQGHTELAKMVNETVKLTLHKVDPHARDVVLRPGDLLVFHNYRVAHRRVPFQPRSGGGARFLRRFYGASVGINNPPVSSETRTGT